MGKKSRYATKKKGKTEGYPFWEIRHIKDMIDYFKNNELWDAYLTFMFLFLFGRRIGDTLDMVWSDIFYANGNIKDEITTIEEQKTGKMNTIYVSPYAKDIIRDYLCITGKNPMEDLDGYIFEFKLKNIWRESAGINFYTETESAYSEEKALNLLDDWCNHLNKDYQQKRKDDILFGWKKKKMEYPTLGKYLYYEVEFKDIMKWQTNEFRKIFNRAVEYCNIPYNVTVHSVRKSFGYYSKIIHPNDILCLETLQSIFGHSSTQQTMHYIGLSAERERQYFNDIGDFLENVSNGNYDIKRNSPVVTLKEQDLRELIVAAMRKTEETDIEKMNRLLDIVSSIKVV